MSMVWQEKPKENREYKGEQRDDKKRRNMLTRMLHSVKGDLRKTKLLKDQTSRFFCLPGKQKKLLGNY